MSAAERDLPQGWSDTTLPQLIGANGVFSDGDWVETKDQDPDGDVRLIQLADVGDGLYRDRSARFLTKMKAADLSCKFLEGGDVLIARMPDPLGRACIFPGDAKRSVTVVDVCIVRMHDVSHRWMMWFVNSPEFRARVADLRKGSTRQRISRKNLATISLPIPPRHEQDRIAAQIDELVSRLDNAIASLHRARTGVAAYRAAVLKAACEGRLVPTEAKLARTEGREYEPADQLLAHILKERRARWEADQLAKLTARGRTPKDSLWKSRYVAPEAPTASQHPKLPRGWCWASIDMVGDLLLGRQRAPQFLTGRYPRRYLRVANVKDDRIDFSDLKVMDFNEDQFEKYRLRSGDIVLSEGQSPELLGRSAIYRGEEEPLCFQKTLHRFRSAPGGPCPEFSQIVFRSHVKSGVFRRYGSITTNIAHLTLEKLRTVPFPLPPAAEQHRIVTEVERRLSIADEAETSIEAALVRAGRLRRAILKRAFEGKLVPQDPDDEPASVLLERIRNQRKAAAPVRPRGRASRKGARRRGKRRA